MRRLTFYPILLFSMLCGTIRAQYVSDGNVLERKTAALTTLEWQTIKAIAANKRIVALGENLHGVKQYNEVKIDLIKRLHEELGFNVLAIESDVARNYFGNEYRSFISDTLLLKELFSPIWHTSEYLDLVQYLHKHPDLKMIGFDVETKIPILQIAGELGVAIDTTTETARSFLNKYAGWPEVNGMNRSASKGERDSTMAEILKWIVRDLYPSERIIVSAHNIHVSNVQLDGACMGQLLKKEFGEDYYSIGFFHSLGNPKHVSRHFTYENKASSLPENSVQYRFLKSGMEQLFVSMKEQRRQKAYKWMYEDLNNVLLSGKFSHPINLSRSFDGVYWIREVTYPEYVIKNAILDK